LAAERGPSSYDVKLNNVTSIVYELPFGKGRLHAGNVNGLVDAIIGGWELNAPQMVNHYFAGYTFTTPPANDPFGDLGRNAFRAPNFEHLDFATDKNFRIREDIHLQFRSEFFNVLNQVNFGIPNTMSNNSALGQIRSTYPARQIQFGLKLLF
jgi:hypothetical protein